MANELIQAMTEEPEDRGSCVVCAAQHYDRSRPTYTDAPLISLLVGTTSTHTRLRWCRVCAYKVIRELLTVALSSEEGPSHDQAHP